jgi:hypothetical protein
MRLALQEVADAAIVQLKAEVMVGQLLMRVFRGISLTMNRQPNLNAGLAR